MTTVIVPYRFSANGLKQYHVDFQQRRFAENRRKVLDELRLVSGVPEVVRGLNQETVYKLVSKPQNATLDKGAHGIVKGIFRDESGRIVEHAKFKAIGPSLIKAASAVGSQVLLISIAMQLNQIEKKIERIITELHNDRLAEIEAGVQQFENAMWVEDCERRSRLVENAVQTLTKGLKKTMRSLKDQIEALPDTRNSFLDNWISNKSKKAEQLLQPAMESFFAGLLGIKTLSECYAVLDEPIAAGKVLQEQLQALKQCGIPAAAKKARLVSAKRNFLPEAPFRQFLDCEATTMANLKQSSVHRFQHPEQIEIEFKPKELMEVSHAGL